MSAALQSPLVAAYLAADRIAKPAHIFALHAPCKDVKVSYQDLAAKMLAAAFLQLRDDGAVAMEVVEQRRLFARTRSVRLHSSEASRVCHEHIAGLAACIAEVNMVYDVVRRWLGVDSENPWAAVINTAQNAAVEAGVLQTAQHNALGKIGAAIMGSVRVMPIADRDADVSATTNRFLDWWNAFCVNDAVLATALIEDCARALKSRFRSQGPDVSLDAFDVGS